MNQIEYQAYLNRIKNKFYEPKEYASNTFDMPYEANILLETKYYDDEMKMPLVDKNESLSNLEVGFEKGNIFKELYEPYKNYQPKNIRPKTEQEEIFLRIEVLAFAMHEINLYLSVYPDDMKMIGKYHELQGEYAHALKHYEAKYMPIECNSEYMTTSPYTWTETPWPWDRRDF